jgi:hypothetical protein
MEKPREIDHPVFGHLIWDDEESAWNGTTQIGGHQVELSIDTTLSEATRAEQDDVLRRNELLLPRVLEAEPNFHRQAARDIAEAASEQADDDYARDARASVDELADSLELQVVVLHEGGELHYRDASKKFIPDLTITVYYEEDISYGGVEVY